MESPKVIRKIALAVFKDKKLLLVRSKDQPEVFFAVGGKLEEGESEIECLMREVKEEISCDLDKSSITLLAEFEDAAHGRENTLVNIRMYTGELTGEPTPSSEIAEMNYFDSSSDPRYLAEITIKQIFPWMKARALIN